MTRIQLTDVELNVVQRGSGVPLLLVHGFPLDHGMWNAQIDDLASACRVIAPDLRGFGDSTGTPGTVSMEQFADDLNALLDKMDIQQPVVFCGLSMGGYIGWQFWRKYSDRLAGLILCDTRAAADTAEAARGRTIMAEHVLQEGAQVASEAMLPKLFAASTSQLRPHLVDAVKTVMQTTSPEAVAAAQRGMAERIDATPLLPSIRVPTLVLAGREDGISPPDEMRGIAAAIPGAEFHEIPDAGHMAPLENPAVVNGLIRNFLEKHTMSEPDQQTTDLIHRLRQQRDELRVRMHLAKAEIKEEWDKVERRWDQIKDENKPLTEAIGESAGDLGAALRLVAQEIKQGYERISKSL